MNFSKSVLLLIILCFFNSFGQSKKYIEHKVLANETVTSIAAKYKVTTASIIALNPDAKNGIQLNKTLLIPIQTDKIDIVKKAITKPKSHLVVAKETKYSIAKLYDISIEDLEKANPILAAVGLQPGQNLIVVMPKFTEKIISKENKLSSNQATTQYHIIEPKETKFSISKKYGISIEELEKQNPETVTSFPIGLKLTILSNSKNKVSVVVKKESEITKKPIEDLENEIDKPEKVVSKQNDVIDYKVKSGETLYSLTHLFNLSEEALTNLNPQLKNGVEEGMILKVPSNQTLTKEIATIYKNLSQSITRKEKKELVLFLPFNADKIQNDTINSVAERFKKDKFLNLTLDFYSGVIMAIDSAKVLNLNLNIKIYDSEETKNSTSATTIAASDEFQNANAVIGPFYQVNVEKVAEILEEKNIPVISPLSKDVGKSYKNLYQSMPTIEASKNTLFDYMRSKNGNIIAVIDPKKASVKQYIEENQKNIIQVNLNDKGVIVGDSIKKYFVKDRMNYVVMESERTGIITTTTAAMLKAMKDFQLQLVILEPNETLDFDEIDLTRLTKLKMMYPSAMNENDSDEAKRFEKAYKKKNKIFPNQYAIRGFDLTFDTMLRLSQEKSFEETILNNSSEQVEGKFDYVQKASGGYSNNGVSILYYDTDLTIKRAQ